MHKRDKTLWKQIKAFKFEEPEDDYGFSVKLSYENNWSQRFTDEAILEYRKFMFLAAISKKTVSPCHIVDIVWHLHLTCSDSYEEFCNVIGKKVKHVPSKGTGKDFKALKIAAEYTNGLYNHNFNGKNKFIDSVRSFEDTFVIEEPDDFFKKIDNYHLGALCLLLFVPLFYIWKPIILKIGNPSFLWISFFLFLATIIVMYLYMLSSISSFYDGIKDKRFLKYFNEYEVLCYLEKGVEKLILLKIDKMFQAGLLKLNDNKKGILFKKKNGALLDVYSNIIKNYSVEYPNNNLKDVLSTLKNKRAFRATERIGDLLDEKIKSSINYFNIRICVFLSILIFFSLMISRFILGTSNDKPIFFLFVFIIVGVVIMYLIINHFFNSKIKSLFVHSLRDQLSTSEFIDDYFKQNNNRSFDSDLLVLIGSNNLKDISYKTTNDWSSCSSCSSGGGGDGCSSCSSCSSCGGCGD